MVYPHPQTSQSVPPPDLEPVRERPTRPPYEAPVPDDLPPEDEEDS